MVKYNKKFFFDEKDTSKEPKIKEKKVKTKKTKKVDNTNRSNKKGISFYGEKINYFIKKWFIVIIILLVLVIAMLFIKGCNNNKVKPKTINKTDPVIVDSLSINLNQDVPKIEDFVKNYDKVKNEDDTIKYEGQNLVNNKYNAVGNYKVIITIKGKEYTSRIIVLDKEPPVFAVKNVIISEGEYYTINDFVSSCSDNSGKECALSYGKPEFGKITSPGIYTVPIVAADLSGNTAEIQNAKLIINAKPVTPKPVTCKYGSSAYTSDHVLTYSLIENGCAIDGNYAKTDTYISRPDEMSKVSLDQLKTDIENKNISMTIQFSRNVIPILNNEKTGLVGYAVFISADQMEKDKNGKLYKVKTVLSYDLNPNGSRKYTINELGL